MKNTKTEKDTFYFFIGTTAELIKIFPVMHEMKKRNINFKVISSGQNNLEGNEFLKILGIKPDIILSDSKIKKTILGLFFWFIQTYFKGKKIIKKEFKKVNKSKLIIIVHGDTVSTLMGAKLAKLNKISVAHIESGLRSFNYLHPFPEEINRVLVSRLADIHFCPNRWSLDNLKHIDGKKVNTYHNTLIESLDFAMKEKKDPALLQKINKKKFFIFIMHRQENLLASKFVKLMIDKIIDLSKNMLCLFIIHEPTKAILQKLGLLQKILKIKKIIRSTRLPYLECVRFLDRCEFVITDGGSNQEELYYLGKPCLILRKKTERIEGLGENIVLSENNSEIIDNFAKNYKKYRRNKININISPSKIIADNLLKVKNKHE